MLFVVAFNDSRENSYINDCSISVKNKIPSKQIAKSNKYYVKNVEIRGDLKNRAFSVANLALGFNEIPTNSRSSSILTTKNQQSFSHRFWISPYLIIKISKTLSNTNNSALVDKQYCEKALSY